MLMFFSPHFFASSAWHFIFRTGFSFAIRSWIVKKLGHLLEMSNASGITMVQQGDIKQQHTSPAIYLQKAGRLKFNSGIIQHCAPRGSKLTRIFIGNSGKTIYRERLGFSTLVGPLTCLGFFIFHFYFAGVNIAPWSLVGICYEIRKKGGLRIIEWFPSHSRGKYSQPMDEFMIIWFKLLEVSRVIYWWRSVQYHRVDKQKVTKILNIRCTYCYGYTDIFEDFLMPSENFVPSTSQSTFS